MTSRRDRLLFPMPRSRSRLGVDCGRPGLGCCRQEFCRELLDEPHDTGRRDPKHGEEQDAEGEQAIFGEVGQQFRQQHHERRANHRPEGRTGAADHHPEQQQDRLQKRERTRTDIALERSKQGPGQRHRGRRDDESHGTHMHEINADRARCNLGVAGGTHRVAPAAPLQPLEQDKTGKDQHDASDG